MSIVKAGIDIAGVWVVVGAIAGVLPAIGALLAVIWYLFQIWESVTFQKIWAKVTRRAPPQSQSAKEQEPSKPA